MEFVNSIASIVHMEVALHNGSANKNIGDAFLLVWKFPRTGAKQRSRAGSDLLQEVCVQEIADTCLHGNVAAIS